MKEIKPEEYFKALNSLDQSKRTIFESTVIYDAAETLLRVLHPSIDPQLLIIPTGNYVLGLCSIEELLEEYTKIGITGPFDFFKKISEVINQTSVQLPASSEPPLQNDVLQRPVQPLPQQPNLEISLPRTTPQSLNTVRTMQNDVERIQQETPIHQSSQDALLHRSGTPVQHNPSAPRWETE